MSDRIAQIARKAAEAAVTVEDTANGRLVSLIGHGIYLYVDDAHASAFYQPKRDAVAALVLAAIEEYRRLPVPGGLDEGRLGEIRKYHDHLKGVADLDPRGSESHCQDLLSHVDFLTRLLLDCEDGGAFQKYSESYDAAFKAGAEAQRRADVEFIGRIPVSTVVLGEALDEWNKLKALPLATPDHTTESNP